MLNHHTHWTYSIRDNKTDIFDTSTGILSFQQSYSTISYGVIKATSITWLVLPDSISSQCGSLIDVSSLLQSLGDRARDCHGILLKGSSLGAPAEIRRNSAELGSSCRLCCFVFLTWGSGTVLLCFIDPRVRNIKNQASIELPWDLHKKCVKMLGSSLLQRRYFFFLIY